MVQPASPVCDTVSCPLYNHQIPGQNVVVMGLCSVFYISRRRDNCPVKDLRKVARPHNSPQWAPGKQCKAVICHKGRSVGSGHWIAFLMVNGVCVDNLMELKFFFEGGWGPSLATPPLLPPPLFFHHQGGGKFPILVSHDI